MKSIAGYLLYVAVFSLSAYLLWRMAPLGGRRVALRSSRSLDAIKYVLVACAIAFPFFHWFQLGGMPLWQAFQAQDHIEAVLVRQRIFSGAEAIWRYGASLNILAMLPLLVLLGLVKKSRWFWPMALYALVYAASLMQKSHVIVVLLPATIYAIGIRNFRLAAKLCLVSGAAVVTLILGANPHLRATLDGIMPVAVAATVPAAADTHRPGEKWVAYGSRLQSGVPGRFSSNSAFYLDGTNTIFLRPSDDRWTFGREDFQLEFWVFPLSHPAPGNSATLFWNGPVHDDYSGATRIFHGTHPTGVPYVAFATYDRSGTFSTSFGAKPEVQLKVNQWNHVAFARKGRTLYIGVNGVMDWSTDRIADLTLQQKARRIVQFGGQFGKEYRVLSDPLFKGYLDEIVLAKGVVKYTDNYAVPDHPASAKSVAFDDVTGFEAVSRMLNREPALLKNLIPSWANSLLHRVLFVPGEVVGQWFAVIPDEIPFAQGCGYRPLAALLGCPHVNFSEAVYTLYNPYLVEQGVEGTMNAASFMEDYANFGMPGLVLGGMLLAVLLYGLGVLFAGRRRVGVALNIVPLMYLSSGALLTLLLSGGWLATLCLYAVFYDDFDNRLEGDVCVA
ncbi:LamG-like jellyroll fold domain-containing protein [Noviherbaspirillum cavernae]|nr:LamG-like jellyroll fold domain-containing protein [Noviherbaspirillum cavernae]